MCSECIATSDYWVRETRHVRECAFWRSKVECSKHTNTIDYSEMLTENYSWTFIYSLLIILWLTGWNILSMFLLSTVEIVYGSYDMNILMESQPKAVLTQLVSTNHTLFIYTFVWFSSLSLSWAKKIQTNNCIVVTQHARFLFNRLKDKKLLCRHLKIRLTMLTYLRRPNARADIQTTIYISVSRDIFLAL